MLLVFFDLVFWVVSGFKFFLLCFLVFRTVSIFWCVVCERLFGIYIFC